MATTGTQYQHTSPPPFSHAFETHKPRKRKRKKWGRKEEEQEEGKAVPGNDMMSMLYTRQVRAWQSLYFFSFGGGGKWKKKKKKRVGHDSDSDT